MKNIETQLKIAQHFKTVLFADDFVITGSVALTLLGFNVPNVKDIDIILVNPTEQTRELLVKLQQENPPKNLSPYPTSDVYRFIHDGVEMDVFVKSKPFQDSPVYSQSGIKIAPISHIVKWKLAMNRSKDYIQLYRLAKQIMSATVFNDFLSSDKL
jgi:hypothetical protein